MSRHVATHAYTIHAGWVRIPPTTMTSSSAAELRGHGFTIVRSRRGLFGVRELPLAWYLDHALDDTLTPSRGGLSPAAPDVRATPIGLVLAELDASTSIADSGLTPASVRRNRTPRDEQGETVSPA